MRFLIGISIVHFKASTLLRKRRQHLYFKKYFSFHPLSRLLAILASYVLNDTNNNFGKSNKKVKPEKNSRAVGFPAKLGGAKLSLAPGMVQY